MTLLLTTTGMMQTRMRLLSVVYTFVLTVKRLHSLTMMLSSQELKLNVLRLLLLKLEMQIMLLLLLLTLVVVMEPAHTRTVLLTIETVIGKTPLPRALTSLIVSQLMSVVSVKSCLNWLLILMRHGRTLTVQT